MTTLLRRTIHPEVRIVDAATGTCDYVASDETLDAYREIIRAAGWRFDNFQKNAPFVDSHNYESVDCLLGKVIDFRIENKQLIERVQWAIDVPENKLATLGWKMTQAGYLKAVSVGFWPQKMLTPFGEDPAAFVEALIAMGHDPKDSPCRCIHMEQQQVELSACIIGANPNALAKAFKSGCVTDADLETFSAEYSKRETANATLDPAVVALAKQRAQEKFLADFNQILKGT